MLEPPRLRFAPPVALVALALPAQASAHGRGATIALDYRIALDPSVRALLGVHERVLDGDRDLQVRADRGVRLRGRSRVHAAGVVGAVAAAVSLSSLSVFRHGVVISLLPGTATRLLCVLAVAGGAAAAVLSFLHDFDEPVRVRRPLPR